jgi:hypothetical protein
MTKETTMKRRIILCGLFIFQPVTGKNRLTKDADSTTRITDEEKEAKLII